MGFQDVEIAVQIVVADAQSHAGLLHAVFVQGHSAFQANLGKSSVVVVFEKKAGGGVAGNIDVGPAVVVKIGGGGSHAVAAFGFRYAGLGANVRKGAVAVVVVQRYETRRQSARPAVDRYAFPVAEGAVSRLGDFLRIEVKVVSDE